MALITVYDKRTGDPVQVDQAWIDQWPDDFDLEPKRSAAGKSSATPRPPRTRAPKTPAATAPTALPTTSTPTPPEVTTPDTPNDRPGDQIKEKN